MQKQWKRRNRKTLSVAVLGTLLLAANTQVFANETAGDFVNIPAGIGLNFDPMNPPDPLDLTNYVDITINQPYERTGLELGTDSYARGEGSISTGTNSIAIGRNSVATGSGEDAASIRAKLAENTEKLAEIEASKDNVKRMGEDLNALKIREQKTIEAGLRVEQLRKSKEAAKGVWNTAEQAWQDKIDGTAAAFAEHQRKLDDLNSRLSGVSQLTHTDISSPQGLTAAAQELKDYAERGTSLNLSMEFYKDYVGNYYKALGDLRKNNKIIADHGNRTIIDQIRENPLGNDLSDIVLQFDSHSRNTSDKASASSVHNSNDLFAAYNNNKSPASYISVSKNTATIGSASFYNSLGEYKVDNGVGCIVGLTMQGGKTGQIYNGEFYQTYWNVEADTVDQATFDKWNAAKDGWRAQIHDANHRSGDEVFGKFDTATDGKSTILFNMVTDMKFELVDLDYQICYYQGKYEETKDVTWLDKKKVALNAREEKLATNEQTIKDKYQELFGKKLGNTNILFNQISRDIQSKWTKENITDVKEKNKITTDTLTAELERELGINKDAIQQYEKEIQTLRDKADQARRNYEGLNPSEEDLILAREYERVAQELEQKADALKSETEKLEQLQNDLTLNDLANVGADAIAYGTNALVTGKAAIGIGKDVVISAENAIGIGTGTKVSAANSVAIGANNNVSGDNTFALGTGIQTNATNAVVLGANSTGADNSVSIGAEGAERKLIHLKEGVIGEKSTDAINGSQLYAFAQSPTQTPGFAVGAWQQALGNGKNAAGNTGLITGDTLHKAMSSIDVPDDILNVKYDSDANQITLGKSKETVVPGAKRPVVREKLPDPIKITNLAEGVISATSKDAINGLQLYTELAKKADKDAGNLSDEDVAKWQEKLGTGTVAEGDKGLVTGNTVYDAVKDKADTNLNNITVEGQTVIKNIAKDSVKVIDGTNTTVTATTDNNGNKNYAVNVEANGKAAAGNTGLISGDTLYKAIQDVDVSEAVKNKANTNLNNITVDGKTVIKNIAQDSVKVIDGTNTTVTATTDKDGNKNYAVNVAANGKVEAGNTGIVNGGTVYESVKNKADKKDLLNLATVTQQQLVDLDGRMRNGLAAADNKINQTGALAAALAGMKPLDYDGTERTQISAAVGQYHNKHAVSLGAYHYFNRDLLLSGGLAWQGSDVMANVGVTLRVGKRDENAISRNADVKELADEVIELRKQNKDINAQLEDLLAQIKVLKGSKEKAHA